MATKPKFSEAETMEQYRVALENAVAQPAIAAALAELGYDTATISEGKTLLLGTRQSYDANKTEDDETSAAYSVFSGKREKLDDTFTGHRKKAKVIFRKDPVTAEKLMITGSLPRTYIKWLEATKKFYSIALSDRAIQVKLYRLKITVDDLNAANTLISEVESTRSEYLKEKGESQASTQAKDDAFAKLDDWMSEFYAVAKIGLEDNPQLLESLGKLVRN